MTRETPMSAKELEEFREAQGLPRIEGEVQKSEEPREKRAYKKRIPEENK